MESYFFLTSTTGQGTINDPAEAICKKYNQGDRTQIHYGNCVAVCAITHEGEPDITEVVQMKTRQQVIDLVHPNLPNFDGLDYITNWEKEEAIQE